MAESEPRSEESHEEELPALASLLQHSPSPRRPGLLRRRLSSSSAPKPDTKAGAVVVVSSGSGEEEVEEVVPLSARMKRRMKAKRKAVSEPPQPGGGDAGLCARGDLLAPGSGRPQEALVSTGDVSCGSQNGTRGAEWPSLCPLPASQSDSADHPSRPLVSGASPETSPSRKKPKYSQKEKEVICQAAWQRRKEREARRRQQEQEKERKRAFAKMLKAQRPGECQKYITVVLDPVLLQVEGGGQILSALQAANYSCVVENQAVPCSITWRRKTVSSQMEEGDEWTEEPNVLVLLRLEEFLSMVHNYKQEAQGCTEGEKETLQTYVAHVMEKMPRKILALAAVGVENYFRSLRVQPKKRLRQAAASGKQEEQRKRRKKEVKDSGLEITRMDMEEALVDLQLCKQVQVSFFESCEDLGEFATMFTKAVAEAPFKRERDKTGFSFYLENRWCRGVKVDPSGKGLLEVWKRQIQQFNHVSLKMAEAIVSAYPSPQLLNQAYSRCSSEQERENMLADIPVHRSDGVTATSRRIGPELSRRIYLQMTSHNPDLYLDSTR
ncbi:crossover junction endonuclease EME1 isoform X1 [Aquila chrysaetos chrysaetos]|uniref:crossover junction endonuclease EME1 isoform X1 n=1 Tax=Aquila chrysaetos chrysaetos TaxID=223781 RepID=UPI00117719EC|nr:crossover junction endonuclease EME1 isoform X1 [Aquila chrysaetos chrysaetos]